MKFRNTSNIIFSIVPFERMATADSDTQSTSRDEFGWHQSDASAVESVFATPIH